MWYDSKHTQILDSKEAYDLVAEQYSQYHKHLDSFYAVDINRFLPKKEDLKVIDLWAGDGRVYNHYSWINFTEYLACDISEKMLQNHPRWKNIKTKVLDLQQEFGLPTDHFDFATAFFVLEHLDNLDLFFKETYKILKPWGRLVIWHFLQRREFKRKQNKEQFKIQQYKHKLEDLKEHAQFNFFDFHYFESVDKMDKRALLWYIIICEKN